MRSAWAVFLKELVDALRDRRTLTMVFLSSVAMGPLVLVLISTLVSNIEKRAEARELVAVGLDAAPTLKNYLQRQTYTMQPAPPDYERQLTENKLGDPVLVVPGDFEAKLASGEVPVVEVVSSAANQRAQGGVGRLTRLMAGFKRIYVSFMPPPVSWPVSSRDFLQGYPLR